MLTKFFDEEDLVHGVRSKTLRYDLQFKEEELANDPEDAHDTLTKTKSLNMNLGERGTVKKMSSGCNPSLQEEVKV